MPMIQEFIGKTGYTTACVLFDNSQEIVGEFSYERVKEYPLSGGPTVIGISSDDREAKRYAAALLQEADWRGPAEVEFILDQNGAPILLEVNPRLWMPIQLVISAGVDFPEITRRLAVGEKPAPVGDYEVGLEYRWALPNEILWLINMDEKLRDLRDFLTFDPRRQYYGSLSIRDPGPVAGTFFQSMRFINNPKKRKTISNRGWS